MLLNRSSLLVCSLSLAAAALAQAPVAEEANRNYQTREGRDQVAANLARPERDETQRPAELVAALNLRAGMTVADLGTGVGYMLPYLSRAVGASGKVYAEDIQTDFLDRAKAKAADDSLGNVEFFLGTEKDAKLPAASVDAALVLDVYHHVNYPEPWLNTIHAALKPGARLYIVDYHRAGREDHIRLDRDDVAAEIGRYGFRLVSKREHEPANQYILEFERP